LEEFKPIGHRVRRAREGQELAEQKEEDEEKSS